MRKRHTSKNKRNEKRMKNKIWLKYKNQHNSLMKDHYSRLNKRNF